MCLRHRCELECEPARSLLEPPRQPRTRQQARLWDLAQGSENRLMSSGSYHSTEEIASGKYNVDLDSD